MFKLKRIIKKIPIANQVSSQFYYWLVNLIKPFMGSGNYWIERYHAGGNSGDGSQGLLAEYKAEIINSFVEEKNINKVIEYGCGDGNQLKFAKYPSYLGFDISARAIELCKKSHHFDTKKSFKLINEYKGETADLTLSLDVVYHLIEDNVFYEYLNRLFNSSEKFVIIYSSNTDINYKNQAPHVKHRNFTGWVMKTKIEWKLIKRIPNKYPYYGNTNTGSFSDFFIFEKLK